MNVLALKTHCIDQIEVWILRCFILLICASTFQCFLLRLILRSA
jgi:hypothetical protein